ncbi:MAG: frataxin domain-containing protein [Acidobacteriaceae bacterium]
MLDAVTFRRHASDALQALKKSLVQADTEAEFEVEEQQGALHITCDDPPARIILTPSLPMRQICISAFAAAYPLDWDEVRQNFVLAKIGETLPPLLARLITQHLGSGEILLS